MMEIRAYQPADCQAVCDIYNYYIENTVISFEESALAADDIAQRVMDCTASYPWLVGIEGKQVIGYAYANRWQLRCAYRNCVETTVYLKHGE